LNSSSNEIKNVRWIGHAVCMGDENFIQNFNQKNVKSIEHLRDLAIIARILLKWILQIKSEVID
jgi:hypothetical protein